MIPASVLIAFIAIIFFAIDKHLGVIMAIVIPAVVGADGNGTYAEVLVVVLFALAVWFVRKIANGEED
jgi:hypothetical protein